MPRNDNFKAGMFLLETLTTGMYNEPLSIYREYIQNAVDSIDSTKDDRNGLEINITLDIDHKRVAISDNGGGIPSTNANKILSGIGISNKRGFNLRGFRGIGRLGGIAFCDRAIFRTKSRGELVESIQEWDCRKMRYLLSQNNNSGMTLDDLFEEVTYFRSNTQKRKNQSYFEVTLEGVSSFRNYVFDIQKVNNYISQVAPLPFDADFFSYSKTIDNFLNDNLNHYGKYKVLLNGISVKKPYKDSVKITKGGHDKIKGVKFFTIKVHNQNIAFGWVGEREKLSGSIVRGDPTLGIRIRTGNILMGDAHLLDKCFREPRFNSYIIGEIHVVSSELIPNSRRDDFIDNQTKNLFYTAIEKEIGLPLSKEIRLRSRLIIENIGHSINENKSIFKIKESTEKLTNDNLYKFPEKLFDEIEKNCKGCYKLPNIFKKILIN